MMKSKYYLIKKILFFALISVYLTSCGASQAATKTKENAENIKVNNYGRQLAIEKLPQKVITMGPNCSELFVALGLNKRVIGDTLNNHSRGALPEYKKDYDKIPELTHGSATREAVLGSGADFIYGLDWEFGEGGLDIGELSKYGITVYQNKAKSIEEELKEIDDLGKIFHVSRTSESLIKNQKERIQKIRDNLPSKKKRVLVFDSGEKGVFTASGSNFESRLIEAAGGENIFGDMKDKEWITVSGEEILNKDPEVIIVHDYDQPALSVKMKQILNDPILSQTSAIKKKKIITIPLEGVLPGIRMASTIETFRNGFE